MTEDSRLESVDFEIALTALLATLVTAYPAPDLAMYPLVKLAAISLLALTLIKRMAVGNGLTTADRPIRIVTYLMEPASSVAILYCCFVGVRTLVEWLPLPSGSAAAWGFAIVTPVLVLGYLVSAQLIFGDLLGEGEQMIAVKADQHRGEMLGWYLDRFTGWAATTRTGEPAPQPAESRASDQRRESLSLDEQLQRVANVVSLLLLGPAVVLAYILIPLLAASTFGVSWPLALLLWVAVLSVTTSQKLWYSRYGLFVVQDRNRVAMFLDRIAPYLVVILLVG